MSSPSTPERDRRLAQKPRYAWRDATDAGDIAGELMKSEVMRQARRFAKVRECLRSVLGPRQSAKVKPATLAAGVLTLEAEDTILLSELRNVHHTALLGAFAAAGTGVSRVVVRLQRQK